MILQLELPPDLQETLETEATERGISLPDYALSKLRLPDNPGVETGMEGVLRLRNEIYGDMPEEERKKLLCDFSINHNHYLHGSPKVKE